MAVTITDVRNELQLDAIVMDDTAVQYSIDKVALDNLDLVCAQVLRQLLSKFHGRTRLKIGKFEEVIDPGEIRKQIRVYMGKSGTGGIDDGFTHPDAFFTRTGI